MKKFLKRLLLSIFPLVAVVSGLLVLFGAIGFFFSEGEGIGAVALWSLPIFLISTYITHRFEGGWSDVVAWLLPFPWLK